MQLATCLDTIKDLNNRLALAQAAQSSAFEAAKDAHILQQKLEKAQHMGDVLRHNMQSLNQSSHNLQLQDLENQEDAQRARLDALAQNELCALVFCLCVGISATPLPHFVPRAIEQSDLSAHSTCAVTVLSRQLAEAETTIHRLDGTCVQLQQELREAAAEKQNLQDELANTSSKLLTASATCSTLRNQLNSEKAYIGALSAAPIADRPLPAVEDWEPLLANAAQVWRAASGSFGERSTLHDNSEKKYKDILHEAMQKAQHSTHVMEQLKLSSDAEIERLQRQVQDLQQTVSLANIQAVGQADCKIAALARENEDQRASYQAQLQVLQKQLNLARTSTASPQLASPS